MTINYNDYVGAVIMPNYTFGVTADVKKQEHKPGDVVSVVLEGTVVHPFERTSDTSTGVAADGTRIHLANRSVKSVALVHPRLPVWRAGDVVSVKFREGRTREYTYARGFSNWPGDSMPLNDSEVDRLWREGLVRHLVRDGQTLK